MPNPAARSTLIRVNATSKGMTERDLDGSTTVPLLRNSSREWVIGDGISPQAVQIRGFRGDIAWHDPNDGYSLRARR